MAKWNIIIKVSGFWRDNTMTVNEKAIAFTRSVARSGWASMSSNPQELEKLVSQIGRSTTASEFDAVLARIYDLADIDRVWIDTLSPPRNHG